MFFLQFFHSYPLLNIPLPGTIPTKIILPYGDQTTPLKSQTVVTNSDDISTGSSNASYEQPPFPWANSDPFVYIQQIVMRSSVLPWRKNLLLTDAYRGPLHEIFKLLEIVRNHEEETSKTNLANICLHVDNVKMPTKYSSIFPEYNCLILSPANLWQQNAQYFKKDTNLLSTIYHHHVRHLCFLSFDIFSFFPPFPLYSFLNRHFPLYSSLHPHFPLISTRIAK